jgi:hypothetical protein
LPKGRAWFLHRIFALFAAKALRDQQMAQEPEYVAALQNDGKAGLYHLHAVFNLVDPVTKTMRSEWHEAMKCREASRRIEFEQGWERADNRTKRETCSSSTRRRRWASSGLRTSMVEARKRGAVVIETGDDKQFQAVAYGDALGMARAIEPGVDMATTIRQPNASETKLTLDDHAVREPVESRKKQRTPGMPLSNEQTAPAPEQIDPLETAWRKAYADATPDEPRLTFAQAQIVWRWGSPIPRPRRWSGVRWKSTTQAAPDRADAAFNPLGCIEDMGVPAVQSRGQASQVLDARRI